jgi:RNA polymerase sigma-70 factor (ECF subfamily)
MENLPINTIKKAAKGNRAAFKQLYDHYAPYLWKVIFRTLGGDETMAADVLQETFMRIFKSLRSFKSNASISTWMYRIAHNTSLSHLKRQRSEAEFNEETMSGNNRLNQTDRIARNDEIDAILSILDPRERYLLTAREVAGLSFDELSEITGKSPGALRTQLHRIKATVKQVWETKQGKELPLTQNETSLSTGLNPSPSVP